MKRCKLLVLLCSIVCFCLLCSCTTTIKEPTVPETIPTTTEAVVDLTTMYARYCNYKWADVASDGTYLSIDTNPNDSSYNSYESEAINAILSINNDLELPESLNARISNTRAIDGTQTASYNNINISWIYHPDKGLSIIWEKLN